MSLKLYTPKLEDLWFRQMMLEDKETMSYNQHWGGTISFPENDWQEWFDYWVSNPEDKRFYRYLEKNGTFVGEIAYHFSNFYKGYMVNIIIYSKYRHQGFGKEGLDILCKEAKARGVAFLYDDIALDNPAIKMFLDAGFIEQYRNDEIIMLKKEL